MPITTQPVRSSNIAEVGYSPESEVLHVRFKSGALWEYTQITPEKFASFINAPSVGGYYAAFIKSTGTGRKLEDATLHVTTTDATLAADLAASIMRASEIAAETPAPMPREQMRAEYAKDEATPGTLLHEMKQAAESRRYVPPVLDDLAGPFVVALGGASPKYSAEGGTDAAADLIAANKVIQADVDVYVAGVKIAGLAKGEMIEVDAETNDDSGTAGIHVIAESPGYDPTWREQGESPTEETPTGDDPRWREHTEALRRAAMEERQIVACPRCLGLAPLGCPECAGIGSVSR